MTEHETSDMDISDDKLGEGEEEGRMGPVLLQPPRLEAKGERVTGLNTDKLR